MGRFFAVVLVVLAFGAGTASAADRFLVFVAGSMHGLELVDEHGRVVRTISHASFGTIGRWSPNGREIAWKDPAGVHVENADGSGARLLVPTATRCKTCQSLSFVWSPDGRALVVGSAGPTGNELVLVPIGGGSTKVLAASTIRGTFFTPAFWTPDGRSLVYGEEGTTLAYPGAVTRMLTPATGRTRTLWKTATSQAAHPPLFSPDLREVAHISEVDQYHQRLSIGTRVVHGVNPTNLVAWSPDSRELAVVASGGRVVLVGVSGKVLRHVGPGQQVYWGRGGELLILRGNYNQVWLSRNGRAPTLLFALPKTSFVASIDAG